VNTEKEPCLKYFDSGSREPAHALASWLSDILVDDVVELRLQTGFFSLDGIGLFMPTFAKLKDSDRPTKVLIGSNDGCTLKDDVAGLVDVLGVPRNGAQLGVINFGGAFFHPKTYYVKRSDGSQAAYVGSANLTTSGLALHVEAAIALDTRDGDAHHHLSEIATAIDKWFTENRVGMTLVNSMGVVDRLVDEGVLARARLPRPQSQREIYDADGKTSRPRLKRLVTLPKVGELRASVEEVLETDFMEVDTEISSEKDTDDLVVEVLPAVAPQLGNNQVFLMTLQKTDVGVGQTTTGTSRRSPEIFIPLAARDADADFWGWPTLFSADPTNNRKMDRFGVKMRIGTSVINVNMMTWPAKHDFRLRSEELRSAGNIGDILYMERSDGMAGFTYYVEVIPQGSALHAQYLAKCVNNVQNSIRKWGYI